MQSRPALLMGSFLFFLLLAAAEALPDPGSAATTLDAVAALPFPTSAPPPITFFSNQPGGVSSQPVSNGLANLLLLEQGVVIVTDDWAYPHSRHDAGKMDPLTGLPFARNVLQESLTAMTMNVVLRNPHRHGLLLWTSVAFPVLERSIVGSMFHAWKTQKL